MDRINGVPLGCDTDSRDSFSSISTQASVPGALPSDYRISWVHLDLCAEDCVSQATLASLSALKPVAYWRAAAKQLMLDGDKPVFKVFNRGRNDRQAEQMMKHLPFIHRVGIGALAGGIAGGFTNVVLHPIDTVKTKLQTRGSASMYSGPFDVVHKVLASQGIWGLYSGVQAAFVGSVLSSAVYFGTYELGKSLLCNVVALPKTMMPPLAAALGNVTSSAILVPKEVVKQRMQAGATGSARDVFLHTIKTEGVVGLYAGYSAALLRNLPSNMISFSTFEYLKLAWLARSGGSVLAPWQSVLSGALAGSLSAAITTPLDVAKTRLMTQARLAISSTGMIGMKAEAAARAQAIAAYTYTGVRSTLQQIYKEEGAAALMKGSAPRIFYSCCFSALGFCVFETTRAFFLSKHIERNNNLNKTVLASRP